MQFTSESLREAVKWYLRDEEAAIGEYDKAIQIDPHYTEARWNRAVVLMALGRYPDGVQDWHLRRSHRSYRARRIGLPEWDGKKLDSGRLLIHAEQGLGDQILYASLLPLIAGRARELTLETEPRLVPLFARSFPETEVIAAARRWRAAIGISLLPAGKRDPKNHAGW